MNVIDSPEHSALTFVPRSAELALVTDVALVHGPQGGLALDLSPFGDPELAPVRDLSVAPDGGAVRFDAAGEQYEVRSGAPCDHILFGAMAELAGRGRSMRHDGTDRIEVLFEHGRLESLRIGRFEEGDPDAYVSVIVREEGMFSMRYAPRERVRIRRLRMDGAVLIAQGEERSVRYEIDAEPFVLDLVGALIAVGALPATLAS